MSGRKGPRSASAGPERRAGPQWRAIDRAGAGCEPCPRRLGEASMRMRWSGVAAALAFGVAGGAWAQDRTLYLAAYGGSYETIMRDKVLPGFERANGVRVAYVAGNSTDTLAKIQAQRARPDIDVI